MEPASPKRDVTIPRPNPKSRWRCGFESVGMSCSAGPTEQGECCQVPARKSCAPGASGDCLHRCEGAANCEIAKLRPESRRLTNDDLGPCIPTKSAWFSRESIALNMAIFAGGILLCCMALPQREAVFLPGTLSKKHAQILGNELVTERCSLCHPNSHSLAGGANHGKAVTQDDLCINCHQTDLRDSVHRLPHDLTDAQLNRLQRDMSDTLKSSVNLINHTHAPQTQSTECASCHIEHQGAGHDLQAITNQRCQACHRSKFASFGNGHPEFEDFPYRTERKIAFDHRAHADKYFAQKSESFDCKRCHLDADNATSVGPIGRSVGFEKACAQCHSEPLRAAVSDGWALLQIPSIEIQDMQLAGLEQWPAGAQFGYDGPLTLPMRILLAADPQVVDALGHLPTSGQLADIDPKEPEQVAAAQTVAQGVRRLLAELAVEGQQAWHRRLTTVAVDALKRNLTSTDQELIGRMTMGLPPDLFRQIETEWFSASENLTAQRQLQRLAAQPVGFQDELLLDDSSQVETRLDDNSTSDFMAQKVITKPIEMPNINGRTHVTQGGWYLDQELLAVRYMPRGHADPLLAAWTEYVVLLTSSREKHHSQLELSNVGSKMIPGGCAECHLLSDSNSSVLVGDGMDRAWKSVARSDAVRPFTRFDHAPHLTLPMIRDCRYCHVLEEGHRLKDGEPENLATVLAQHRGSELTAMHATVRDHLHTEFRSMEKSQCNACHRPNGAGDGCTQCHNYHVGNAGFEWSRGTVTTP